MKVVVLAFNQEQALVGAFSVIVQPVVEPMDRFTALFQVLAASAGTVWAGVCRGGKLGPGLGGDSLLYGGPGHLLPNTAPDWGPSVGSGDTLDIRLGLEDRAVNQPSRNI